MSWRRFKTLLRGLRPGSAWALALQHERRKPVDDPDAAERLMDRWMGG